MAVAPDMSNIYSTPELQQYASRVRPNLLGLWTEDFLNPVTPEERLRAGAVSLETPLLGVARHPLEFYSDPPAHTVVLPIASIKFIDDLGLALAYCAMKGHDVGVVYEYAAVLRFRPGDVPGSPLDTLGVPRAASKDQGVDDLAQKILKSIVFYVAAHEYAHVMYQHKGYKSITARQAQQQEIQSDAFALEIMRRIGVPPTGVTQFFQIAACLEATPGDFASSVEYESYLRQQATHPVNALRLVEIAAALEENADAFARLQADPPAWRVRLQREAAELREIARTLDDRKMRLFLAERARTTDVAALRVAQG